MNDGAAFFDFDKTLIDGDAGPLFGWYLFRARSQTIRSQTSLPGWAIRMAGNWGRYAGFVASMGLFSALYKAGALRRSQIIRLAYRGLRGVPAKPFEELLDEFVDDEIVGRIYPDMVKEIEQHLAAGRPCVVITTGLENLVRRCLEHFPDGVQLIGCHMDIHNGRLTGKVRGPLYGADKANIIRAFCVAAGIRESDSYAYTDHFSDYHMLELVGHGVCVNPAGRLQHLAAKNNWRIMRPVAANKQ